MEQKWETCWQRACKDTEHFRKSGWSFWAWEVVGAAVFGVVGTFVGYWLTPLNSNPFGQFAYPTIGGGIGVVVGFVVVFALIFTWNLFRASYKQRDEARALIKSRKPVPLSNRNELIKAIAEIKTATIKYIYLQDTRHTRTSAEVIQARERYEKARERLESERLIAGKEYEPELIFLDVFTNIQAVLSEIPDKDFEDEGKGKLRGTKLAKELERLVDATIKRIDIISQPNFDTRGSLSE